MREGISAEVIGQDRAVRRLLRAVASYYSGLKDPRRPIGGFILAGPTGVGKTWMAKVFARHFLGGIDKYRDYLTRIDCSTLSQEHEVARLTGSPPGYVGYGELSILAQQNIDYYHFMAAKDWLLKDSEEKDSEEIERDNVPNPNKPYRSVILFDEIEKAHRNIWNVLLQIMEEGELQLGKSGKRTYFNNSVIILTTNIGQRNIQGMFKGRIGFSTSPAEVTAIKDNKDLDDKIYETVKEQIKKTFPPELFKRLDLIVFRPLKEDDFVKILDIFLTDEQEKLDELLKSKSRFPIKIEYTQKAKNFLLKEGVDIHYGARTLRATIEKYIRAPISNSLSSGEIRTGDEILVDEEEGNLVFFRKPRPSGQNAIIPKP